MKSLVDLNPTVAALTRRGFNKTSSKESSSFFGFSKKSSTSQAELATRASRMHVIHLLLKNSNIKELQFMRICEELRDSSITSLLKVFAEKLQEAAGTASKDRLGADIDTIDL